MRSMTLKACHCCGLIHELPELTAGQGAACTRCGAMVIGSTNGRRAAARTAALSAAALVLFWPAVLLPIIEVERLGHRHASSLLVGTLEMLRNGSWFVGSIVLVFSIVFPLTKLGTRGVYTVLPNALVNRLMASGTMNLEIGNPKTKIAVKYANVSTKPQHEEQ